MLLPRNKKIRNDLRRMMPSIGRQLHNIELEFSHTQIKNNLND